MALIKCSNCEKEISDKAKFCPKCGQPVVLVVETPEEKAPILCEECGAEIPDGVDACSNCGCPVATQEVAEAAPQKVEITAVNLTKATRVSKKYIVVAAVAVIAAILALFVGKSVKEKKAAEAAANYASTLEAASYTMLLGAVDAEDAGNLIHSVWYNAIYEKRDSTTDKYTRPNGWFVDDFNDALSKLFSDSSFKSTISAIESNQSSVAGLMKELKNPPEEYEDAYEAIKELYDAYTALTNLVTSPTGSLQSFTQDFNDAVTEVVNCYNTMELYIG